MHTTCTVLTSIPPADGGVVQGRPPGDGLLGGAWAVIVVDLVHDSRHDGLSHGQDFLLWLFRF